MALRFRFDGELARIARLDPEGVGDQFHAQQQHVCSMFANGLMISSTASTISNTVNASFNAKASFLERVHHLVDLVGGLVQVPGGLHHADEADGGMSLHEDDAAEHA